MKKFKSRSVNIVFMFVFFLVSSASVAFGDPATLKTQLLKIASEALSTASEVRRSLIDEKNHLMMEFEKLMELPEDFAKKIGLVNELALIQDGAVAAYEEALEKIKKVEEIWEDNPIKLERMRELLEERIEYTRDFAEHLRKANYDQLLTSLTSRTEFEQNAKEIEKHFENLKATCSDGLHGRNCLQQVIAEYDKQIYKLEREARLMDETNQVQMVQYMDFLQKLEDMDMVASHYAANPEDMAEFQKMMEETEPTKLNPAYRGR